MLDIALDVAMSNGHDADVVKYPESDGAGNGVDHANGEGSGEFLEGVKAVKHVNGNGHTMNEPSKASVNGKEDSASTNGHSQDTSHSDQLEGGDEEMGDAEDEEVGRCFVRPSTKPARPASRPGLNRDASLNPSHSHAVRAPCDVE